GLAIQVVGACPDQAAVRALLATLLPEETRAAVSVEDEGPRYRVAVRGNARTLDDLSRDCAARARQAAAFAADELGPHPIVLGPPVWTIEKGLVFEVAPNGGSAAWAYGAEFRGAYGSRAWSLVGAAGVRGPVTLSFDQRWKADLLRLPLDVGARVTMYRWRLRP